MKFLDKVEAADLLYINKNAKDQHTETNEENQRAISSFKFDIERRTRQFMKNGRRPLTDFEKKALLKIIEDLKHYITAPTKPTYNKD